MEKTEKMLKRIDKHFKNITPEQLNENLEKCGIKEIAKQIKQDDIEEVKAETNAAKELINAMQYGIIQKLTKHGNKLIYEYVKELEQENKSLKKGITKLKIRRDKWKRKYYKLKRELKYTQEDVMCMIAANQDITVDELKSELIEYFNIPLEEIYKEIYKLKGATLSEEETNILRNLDNWEEVSNNICAKKKV